MTQLAPLLPRNIRRYAPTGDRNQGIYLAEIPPKMAALLQDLLGGELKKIEEKIAIETDDQLTDAAIEEEIWQRTNLGPREKRQLIYARIGQGIFERMLSASRRPAE